MSHRRRPGRRPPDRRTSWLKTPPPPRVRGFSTFSWSRLCGSLLPFHGREKRHFYNDLSVLMVLSAAAVGAIASFEWAGLLGALSACALAAAAMCGYVEKARFYRP